MTAKTLTRRLMLGLGAALLVAGLSSFVFVHELVHVLVSFGEEDPAKRQQALGVFKVGGLAATIGAGLIGIALPRPSVRA